MAKVLHKISLDVPPDTGRDFLTKLMGGRLNQQLEDLLAEKKYQCLQAIQPQAIYDLFEIEKIKGESVWFSSGHRFNGPIFQRFCWAPNLPLSTFVPWDTR